MAHPAWLGETFAAVLVVVGGYCLTRLVAVVPLGRRTHADVNLGHVLMAVAMVGMLVPSWRALPNDVWAATFLLLGLWFFARAGVLVARGGLACVGGAAGVHTRHYAVHGVMALSMVYMDTVAGAPHSGRGMAMGAGTGVPALTLLFMVVLLASAAWQLNGIQPVPAPGMVVAGPAASAAVLAGAGSPPERPWLAPRLEFACHIAMCLAMAYMLVLVV